MQAAHGGLLAEEALQTAENLPIYSVLTDASEIVQTLRNIPEAVVKEKLNEVSPLMCS